MSAQESRPDIPFFGRALRAFDASAGASAAQMSLLLGPRSDADDDPSAQWAEAMDRTLHYLLSRATLGVSPIGLANAYFDWLAHLALSPGKQLQLWHTCLFAAIFALAVVVTFLQPYRPPPDWLTNVGVGSILGALAAWCAREAFKSHPGTFSQRGNTITYSHESPNGPADVIVTFDGRRRPTNTFFESAPLGSHEELMDAAQAIKNCVAYGPKARAESDKNGATSMIGW